MLRKIIPVMILIIALFTVPVTTSCDGDALLIGVVVVGILIFTGALSFTASAAASVTGAPTYPPQDFQTLDKPSGSIILECGRGPDMQGQWLKTQVLEPGDVLRIWSESNRGAVALIYDGDGNPFISENYESQEINFYVEMQAVEAQKVFIFVSEAGVFGEDSRQGSESVSVHWEYLDGN